MPATTFLAAAKKGSGPSLPVPCLPRVQALQVFAQAMSKPILFVSAPAGYGKSVTTQLLLQEVGLTPLWLELDVFCNTPTALFRQLQHTLFSQYAEPEPEDIMAQAAYWEEDLLGHLSYLLIRAQDKNEDNAEKQVLVIDNMQLLNHEDFEWILPALLKRLLSYMRIIILSRAALPIALVDLYIKDYISLLGNETLRFSPDEISAFAALHSQKFSPAELHALEEYSLGWPIVVKFLLNNGYNEIQLLSAPHYVTAGSQSKANGMPPWLEQYVRTQIWEGYTEEVRTAILPSACVDNFSTALWHELLPSSNATGLLRNLLAFNGFLRMIDPDCYSWHPLLRTFMRLEWEGSVTEERRQEIYTLLAEFYLQGKQPWQAVRFILRNDSTPALIAAFACLRDNAGCAVEEYVTHFQSLLGFSEAATRLKPEFGLLFARYYYLNGETALFYKYLDSFYAACREDASVFAGLSVHLTTVCLLDHRFALSEQMDYFRPSPEDIDPTAEIQEFYSSLTQNFPFLHRSFRDFSSFALEAESNFTSLCRVLAPFLGTSYGLLEDCLRAGLYWEQNLLLQAQEYALSACARITRRTPLELRFAAQVLLESIWRDLGRTARTGNRMTTLAAQMTEKQAAFMLSNWRACTVDWDLSSGDISHAEAWLSEQQAILGDSMPFYRLYQHFTSLRGMIALGDFETALHFGERLLQMAEEYRRPLDVLEVKTLLCIASWQIAEKEAACGLLEEALQAAQVYGFVRVFAAEGAALLPVISRLSRVVNSADYTGSLQAAFIKKVLAACSGQAKRNKGLTGAITDKPISLSKQQKHILQFLALGLKMSEIAERTGIKLTTVKAHAGQAYRKLEVNNSGDAVSRARQLGLIE